MIVLVGHAIEKKCNSTFSCKINELLHMLSLVDSCV